MGTIKFSAVLTAMFLVFFAFNLGESQVVNAAPLTSGETYTISIEKINSNGTLTSGATSLGLSTTALADANGKIVFSLTGIPNSSTCNFLVITVKDSGNTTVRQSLAPCPSAGGTLPLGVSEMTAKQTTALINAFAAASSDDPILAVFGYTIVRSTGITDNELATIATIAVDGINNGFVQHLTDEGVTTAQLAAYRNAIIAKLADGTDGYSKIMKDAIDDGITDSAAERAKRGEAAAKLMKVLVEAATTAGFAQSLILEGFDAMGAIVCPQFDAAVQSANLTDSAKAMLDSTVGGAIQKIRAEKEIERYSQALTTLGASGADVAIFTAAATTMANAMTTAFQTFEAVFTGSETEGQIQAAQQILDTAMNAAFNAFQTATAASNGRITSLVSAVNTAMGTNAVSASDFTFYNNTGQSNWPIMMVIVAEWITDAVQAGGLSAISYTRDNVTIPNNLEWLGSCDSTGINQSTCNTIQNAFWDNGSSSCQIWNSADCTNNSGSWTSTRNDYVGQGIPASYATIFGVQEDVMIREFLRYSAFDTAEALGQGGDEQAMMTARQALEKAFSDSLDAIADNVTGTGPSSVAVTAAQQDALVSLLSSPQF